MPKEHVASDTLGKDKEAPNQSLPIPVPADFQDIGEVITKLVMETVQSRIRHRALLKTLMDEGKVDWEAYTDNFDQIQKDDAAALFSFFLLKPEIFEKHFAEWRKADTRKYGHVPRWARLDPNGRKAEKK